MCVFNLPLLSAVLQDSSSLDTKLCFLSWFTDTDRIQIQRRDTGAGCQYISIQPPHFCSERANSLCLSLSLGPDPLFAELSLMRLYQWECWKEISIESVWSAILLKQWCDKHPIEKSEEMREYSSEREKFRQLIRKLFQQVSCCCLYSSHSNFV